MLGLGGSRDKPQKQDLKRSLDALEIDHYGTHENHNEHGLQVCLGCFEKFLDIAIGLDLPCLVVGWTSHHITRGMTSNSLRD